MAKPVVPDTPKVDIVQKSKYIVDNLNLFYALCEVDDWGFVNMTDEQQEDIMQALTVRTYAAGATYTLRLCASLVNLQPVASLFSILFVCLLDISAVAIVAANYVWRFVFDCLLHAFGTRC